jgi:hypothetical protein
MFGKVLPVGACVCVCMIVCVCRYNGSNGSELMSLPYPAYDFTMLESVCVRTHVCGECG